MLAQKISGTDQSAPYLVVNTSLIDEPGVELIPVMNWCTNKNINVTGRVSYFAELSSFPETHLQRDKYCFTAL